MPDESRVQIPLIAFEFDASNLKAIQTSVKKLAKVIKDELDKSLESVDDKLEEVGKTAQEQIDKSFESLKKKAEAFEAQSKRNLKAKKKEEEAEKSFNEYLATGHKLQARTYKLLLKSGKTGKGQRLTHKYLRDEFKIKEKMQGLEVKHLRQIARLSDPKERARRLGRAGLTGLEHASIKEARSQLRRRAFGRVMGAPFKMMAAPFRAGAAFKAGRAGAGQDKEKAGKQIGVMKGFKGLNKVLGTVGRVLGLIEKSPMWKIFMTLLDFDGLFRFNKQMLAAAGGIDMLRGSLREGAGAFANIKDEIWDNAGALHDMTDNLRFMVKADERMAALRGFEISGKKAVEFTETFGKGADDITLQAVAIGRVIGLQTSEVANFMGEFIQKMGIARADIGAVFATLITDATESGISQRFFIDQIRMATSSLGMYQFNLGGVSKMLRDMTKDSLQPANVAMKDFESLMQMGKGMSIGQLGATFQIAMRDAGFGRGIATLQRVMEKRLDPKVFGEGLAQRLGDMNRSQFNETLDTLIETKNLNQDQQRELVSVFDALLGLRKGQEGDFIELSKAVKAGALGPDFMAMMLNAVARDVGEGEELRDLSATELKVLSSILGISEETLGTMQYILPSNEDIIGNLEEQIKEQTEQDKRMKDLISISQMVQQAVENPSQAFEIIMKKLVRIIQELLVKLVQTLIPYLVDLTAMILKGIVGLFQLMFSLVNHFVDTGDFGRQLWNTMAKIGGGQQVTEEMVDISGKNWWETKEQVEDLMYTMWNTKGGVSKKWMEENWPMLEAIGKAPGRDEVGDMQKAIIAGYKSAAQPQLDRLAGLIEKREELKKELSEKIKKLKDVIEKGGGEEDKKSLKALEKLYDVTEKYLKLGLKAQETAQKNIIAARSARAMATATTGVSEVISKLEQIPIKKKGKTSTAVPGRAAGGLMITPQIAAFAEREPEIALPLSRVPEVMADTIRLAGATGGIGGISIGEMHFQLPDAAKHNPQAFAQAVRRVFLEESMRLAKGRRPV